MPPTPGLKEAIAALADLLQREKEALTGGRFADAAALGRQKEKCADALDAMLLDPRFSGQGPAFRKPLAAVIALARENEALLIAARQGASAARSRVKELLSRQRNVGVYGESGEKLLTHDAGVTRRKLA